MRDWKKKIVLDRRKLKALLDKKRVSGAKIVFTNGGFDILHAGHLRSLIDARRHADILVVAVNSDESIRGNKGPNLPINPLSERMEVLAALECVDFVTSFSEPTVDLLLMYLKPDFHAKGTDYTKKTVPERDTVLSYGGKILIVGDPKNHSSTGVMEKIVRAFSRGRRKKPGKSKRADR